MKKEIQQGYIALGIVSLFWGTSYTASKIANVYMPGIFLAGIRQFITGSIMTAFFLCKKYPLPSLENLKKIFFQGMLLLFIGNGLVTWSLEFISSGLAAILAALTPLFIAFFSMLLYKSAKVTGWMFAGLTIGLAGVCLIFYDYLGQIGNRSFMLGICMSLSSVLAWSLGSVYSSRQKLPVNILFSVGLQMLISGTLLLVICSISGKYRNLIHLPAPGWYALLYLIMIGSLLSYSAYVFAISKLPPTLVSVYAYINPVVAILLGWMLLKEKINTHMLPGTAIILYGVYLVNREYSKHKI
jgi:drug/metabolite transporter (DMT)-like permease